MNQGHFCTREHYRATRLLDCLYRMGRVMEQVQDRDALVTRILEEARALIRCEAASMARYAEAAEELEFAAATGGCDREILEWRLPLGTGVAGRVALERRGRIVNRPGGADGWFGGIDQATGFHTRNVAAVPIVRDGELIGVLEVVNRLGAEGFSADDLRMLQIFADQVALVLQVNDLIKSRREADRLNAVTVALADAGHSIKNLLHRVQFSASTIEEAARLRNWTLFDRSWSTLRRATDEMGDLVAAMLGRTDINCVHLREVDAAELALRLSEDFAETAEERGIDLRFCVPAGGVRWQLDARRVLHAARNLIENALDAIGEGGGSCIEVCVDVAPNGRELRLTVADDGPGIPDGVRRRVFDPFFSTKGARGTGLGLRNVRECVERHGGRADLFTESGRGSRFVLCFPSEATEESAVVTTRQLAVRTA